MAVSAVDSAREDRRHVREKAAVDRARSGERPEENLPFGEGGGACAARVVSARVGARQAVRCGTTGWLARIVFPGHCDPRRAGAQRDGARAGGGSPARRACDCSGAARRVMHAEPAWSGYSAGDVSGHEGVSGPTVRFRIGSLTPPVCRAQTKWKMAEYEETN